MAVYGGKELAAAFRTVRNNTIKIAEEIPENKYGFSAAPDTRTVQQLLAHIAMIPTVQQHIQSTGTTDIMTVNFPKLIQSLSAEEAKPRSKAETIAMLKSEGDQFASYLEGLSDGFLAEHVSMPPGGPAFKTRLEMLLSPKEHEMHHRGQLMMMQRMMGLVPHLTRQQQERFAAAQAASQAAR